MSIVFVIIFGAIVGFVTSNIRSSGFGLWWDAFFGVVGSAFASSIVMYAYIMNLFTRQDVMQMNLFSVTVGVAGAMTFIYAAWFYNKAIKLIKIKFIKINKLIKYPAILRRTGKEREKYDRLAIATSR